jgi:hypothetical protein
LWSPSASPDYLEDLWIDVEEAMNAMHEWEIGSHEKSIATWRQSQLSAIGVLSECERIALWGLFK